MKRTDNNMDAVRYVLAFSVVVAHFNYLCGFDIPWPVSSSTGVGGFFALSGFLIYRNFDRRPDIKRYVTSRALRILPPYVLIVILCAFALAPFSSLPVSEFFLHPGWWKYLMSNLIFLNFLAPDLPGLFEGPGFVTSAVNGSLWTMKVEWCLYLSVPLVAALIRALHKKVPSSSWIFIAVIVLSIGYSLLFNHIYYTTGKEIFAILGRQVFGQLSYFYMGVLMYYHLDLLRQWKWVFLAAALTGLLIMRLLPESILIIKPVAESTLVIWVSMIGRWGHWFSRHDNVSYDMYLFHFPVIQLAVLLGAPALGKWPAFLICLATVIVLSFLSWNLIGKPFMKVKKQWLENKKL